MTAVTVPTAVDPSVLRGDRYLTLDELSVYSGLSVRKLRDHLRDPLRRARRLGNTLGGASRRAPGGPSTTTTQPL
jgi:hypothetical protein